jgi:flagellar biosynthesis chaperone FliJ
VTDTSSEAIISAIRSELNTITTNITQLRAERSRINEQIKDDTVEKVRLERIVRAVEGRKRGPQ